MALGASAGEHKRLYVFDQAVHGGSPAGSCVLAELCGLSSNYRITVFTARFEAADAPRVRWVRIPLPSGPVFLRYWLFQVMAPIAARLTRWRDGSRPDMIQTTEGQYAGAHVAYAHFCHRAYLQGMWSSSPATGLRRLARWVNHSFNAFWEGVTYRRARCVVVPSRGLARELESCYPQVKGRVRTIPNPVDLLRFERPSEFDRTGLRSSLGIGSDKVVFVFLALGDFGRKGLGLVLDALAGLPQEQRASAHLLVVGGSASEAAIYAKRAAQLKLGDATTFVGLQKDVRPYLWASDALAFPSAYEIFSLVILQAAAASLPVIVTERLYGAEEFIVDGSNGWAVPRTDAGVRAAIAAAIADPTRLRAMGSEAKRSVERYSSTEFVANWRRLYEELLARV